MSRKVWYETEVDGVNFETKVMTIDEFKHPWDVAQYYTIWDAYRNPSLAKLKVWRYWGDFAYRNGYAIRVASRNSQTFTLIMWKNSEMFYITKNHNRRYIYNEAMKGVNNFD